MERDPFYLKLVGHDTFFARVSFSTASRITPSVEPQPTRVTADGVLGTGKFWRSDVVDRSLHFAAAFLDHHPALVRVGKLIADDRSVLVMLVRGAVKM